MGGYGEFSDGPVTKWLVEGTEPNRDMELAEDFTYTDPNGRVWPAPKGAVINGASIPRPLWNSVGSPFTGPYRRAAVVHDVACGDANVPRKDADVMFYHACLAGGCGKLQARKLYAGVRLGAWGASAWGRLRLAGAMASPPSGVAASTLDDQTFNDVMNQLADALDSLPEDASIADIDKVVDPILRD